MTRSISSLILRRLDRESGKFDILLRKFRCALLHHDDSLQPTAWCGRALSSFLKAGDEQKFVRIRYYIDVQRTGILEDSNLLDIKFLLQI